MNGFYMIGRHAECQIRPKTRSVSRRHCLIQCQDESVQLMDLDSTGGTRLNDKKVEPKTWRLLSEGDRVRCGKIEFRISLTAQPPLPPTIRDRATTTNPTSASIKPPRSEALPTKLNAKPNDRMTSIASPESQPSPPSAIGNRITKPGMSQPSIVNGAAWESFDIAGFLETEDNHDREARYDRIRTKNAEAIAAENLRNRQFDDTQIDDTLVEDSSDDITPYNAADSSVFDAPLDNGATTRPGKPVPRTPQPRARARARPKRTWNLAARFATAYEADAIKLTAAWILAAAIVGLVAWKAYHFSAKPDVRVIQTID